MRKHFLISILAILSMFVFLPGCEKTKPPPKEKKPVAAPVTEKKVSPPVPRTETKKVENRGVQEKGEVTGESPTPATQKYEGSATLKRYIDDSP